MTAILGLLGSLLGLGTTAEPPTPPGPLVPYVAPPFAGECTVHQFGEGEVPDLRGYPDDPLCVEYAKRDITLANGGVIRFLLAEPARFALAAGKCEYWQQDHWSVQVAPGQVPLVRWDGSYWFDLGRGQAGARLTGLTVAGQPMTLTRAAEAVAPFSPLLAAYFLRYAQGGDGASVVSPVPFDPMCAG
jgi:hypothetical protein